MAKEFLYRKGAAKHTPTEILATVIPFLTPTWPIQRTIDCLSTTQRLLLVGDNHFCIEKGAGNNAAPAPPDDVNARMLATAVKPFSSDKISFEVGAEIEITSTLPGIGPWSGTRWTGRLVDRLPWSTLQVGDDQAAGATAAFPSSHVRLSNHWCQVSDNPEDGSQTIVHLTNYSNAVSTTGKKGGRKKILSGLISDVSWVAMTVKSVSLTRVWSRMRKCVIVALVFALPIASTVAQAGCNKALDLGSILGGAFPIASWGTLPTTCSCVGPDCTTTGGSAPSGSACQLPFQYNGVTYDECTVVANSGVPWCYVDSGGSNWGNCGCEIAPIPLTGAQVGQPILFNTCTVLKPGGESDSVPDGPYELTPLGLRTAQVAWCEAVYALPVRPADAPTVPVPLVCNTTLWAKGLSTDDTAVLSARVDPVGYKHNKSAWCEVFDGGEDSDLDDRERATDSRFLSFAACRRLFSLPFVR